MRGGRLYTADAMRGVAAVMVVYYHARIIMAPTAWSPRFSYLAVDLFFCLSGFVIARAYDARFAAGMTVSSFMRMRALRLLPLSWCGLALGLIAHGGTASVSGLLTNAVLLPAPANSDELLFPLNPPAWSLFFEVWVANLVYAVGWRHLRGLTLWIMLGLSALGLIYAESIFYRLDIGTSWGTIGGGLARLSFSYIVGTLLARLPAPNRAISPLLILAVLLLCLCAPLEGRSAHIFELACVGLIFPVVVYLSSAETGQYANAGKLLGDSSYAAYAVHFPAATIALAMFPVIAETTTFRLAFSIGIFGSALVLNRLDAWARGQFLRAWSFDRVPTDPHSSGKPDWRRTPREAP